MSNKRSERILELEARIRELPRGTLTYKTINGKKQPYLQWHEEGKLKSRYIKVEGREKILAQIEERAKLQDELISCLAEYYRVDRHDKSRTSGACEVREQNETADYNADIQTSRNQAGYNNKLMPPIGISWYPQAVTGRYYADKTLMIRDILDLGWGVTLFTRPRRFGKTLNMTMLRTFFEKTEKEDRSIYFRDKKIWKCGERYTSEQGRYPVIYLTLKDIRTQTWEDARDYINSIIVEEYYRHPELKNSDRCSEGDRDFYRVIIEKKGSLADMARSIRVLSRMLADHYEIRPVILIDEYDTPIQNGYVRGFYDEIVSFMRLFFAEGLKDNEYMSFAVMTGILRVAKESIFSGMNNLKVYSVLDSEFSEYFGFTESEVRDMAEYYDKEDKIEEIREWYDGYRFGEKDIYNPWSVINYFGSGCKTEAYWLSTSSNEVIGELIDSADNDMYEDLISLMQGDKISTNINFNVIYPELSSSPEAVFSFLLLTGYLKSVGTEYYGSGEFSCELALPNRELFGVYRTEIINRSRPLFARSSTMYIIKAIRSGDADALGRELQALLERSSSYYNTVGEQYYHGLVLGILASLDSCYHIREDRESGDGRYDFALYPKDKYKGKGLPGMIIEIKYLKDAEDPDLEKMAERALAQIDDRGYERDLRSMGINNIIKYGAAFSGKTTRVIMERTLNN